MELPFNPEFRFESATKFYKLGRSANFTVSFFVGSKLAYHQLAPFGIPAAIV